DPDNEYRVTIHSINEPLPEEDFDFRFPKDVQVVDTTQGVEDHKWLLWGADNKPAMEISSPADLLRVDPGGANAGRSQTSARFIAINAALLVLIVLVICIVRRKHRS